MFFSRHRKLASLRGLRVEVPVSYLEEYRSLAPLSSGRAALPDELYLQLIVGREHIDVQSLREGAGSWLSVWSAQMPPGFEDDAPTISEFIYDNDSDLLAGRGYSFAVVAEGQIVGEVSLFDIALRAVRSAGCGYWIVPEFAGRGIIPLAVATLIEFAVSDLDLHRVEINIRPENERSLSVVRKLGMRYEGRREKFLYSDGKWTDHLSFAITAEEVAQKTPLERLLTR
ncbi:GNAT family N-acetyltransferase [Actinomycetaceae bacterium TAE3-ERU4]|nr:GNAT family N-acetyltransferase [Actinomycetaceae bacterium TAE3-ERU4]